jgi:AraC-like DNA-binding protein
LHLWALGLLQGLLLLRQRPASSDRRACIRDFLRRQAALRPTLGDLARCLGISPSRCSHVVRSCCGASFQDLLMQERLNRACALLRTSDLRLTEVAERCGFADVHYFSRCFRNRIGCSPGTFRRRSPA